MVYVGACALTAQGAEPSKAPLRHSRVMWYKTPAAIWDQALPIGNGRLGAMVFGGANAGANNGDLQDIRANAALMDGSQTYGGDEHVQLNESSLWHGARVNRLNPCAHEAFPKVRSLLLAAHGMDGKMISEAEKLAQQCMIAVPAAMPGYSTLGDLYLRARVRTAVSDYRRQLDLRTGIERVTYSIAGVHYEREVFASLPEDVIVLRLHADRKGALSFDATMDRPADFITRVRGRNTIVTREGSNHEDQIRFAGEATFVADGGTITPHGNTISVERANSVTILIAAATDFKGGSFIGADPEMQCERVLHHAQTQGVDRLRAQELAYYRPLFDRMDLQLDAATEDLASLPTDERLKRVEAGEDDPGLQELYFQFARYLLLSSSRRDGLPANLQGLWAGGIENSWGSKWTININTEMNYWPAEAAGLQETVEPLINLVDMLRDPASGTGARVAREYYGARGFVAHHNTDIWGDAEAIDGYQWGLWPMGGAWLSLAAWDHYVYSMDQQFLRTRAWPILQDASQFFLDYLVDDGTGHLVTGPSISPENQYRIQDGSRHSLAMGPTMDIEIVRELLTRTAQAGQRLGESPEFIAQVNAALQRLPSFKVSEDGRLQEWRQDYRDAEPGHRHISHLWALFPGTQISPRSTPELAQAARKSLEARLQHGGGQTGWSRAWIINYWDHLHDAPKAYESMQVMFRQSTFPNLMDTHPPGLFQIDGNLGAANGMLEAIVQSHWTPQANDVDILPALPSEWADGSVHGVRVRGGGTIGLRWKAGKVTAIELHASAQGNFVFILSDGQRVTEIVDRKNAVMPIDSSGRFTVSSGMDYVLHVN